MNRIFVGGIAVFFVVLAVAVMGTHNDAKAGFGGHGGCGGLLSRVRCHGGQHARCHGGLLKRLSQVGCHASCSDCDGSDDEAADCGGSDCSGSSCHGGLLARWRAHRAARCHGDCHAAADCCGTAAADCGGEAESAEETPEVPDAPAAE